MKIGRNDLCPCGSGKKYKKCCLSKDNMSMEDRIKVAVEKSGYDDINDVLCNLYKYMKRKQWWGACHATCSALYVILSELGYKPTLCIGEVLGQGLYFDHSWIEIDGKIIDLAVNMTLLGGAPASGVIVFDKDILTGAMSVLDYGVSGRGIEGEALTVMNLPFTMYMDNFRDENDGLWGVVREVMQKDIDIKELRSKYNGVERQLVRHD